MTEKYWRGRALNFGYIDENYRLTNEYFADKENSVLKELPETLKPYSVLSNNKVTKDSVHPTPFGHGLIAQAVIDYLF